MCTRMCLLQASRASDIGQNHSAVAKAPCKEAVDFARAAVADNPAAPQAVREFAALPDNDAEEAAHRLFHKYHLTIPLTPRTMSIGKGELRALPYIPFSDWLRYLMDEGLVAKHLCGVDEDTMPDLLKEFWLRYEAVHPTHEVFKMGLDLRSVIPCYSHVDEGRAYKKQGILLLSVHGCLGRGTRSWIKRVGRGVRKENLKRTGMGLNYVGSTWGSHFLFCSLHRQAYSKDSTPLDEVMTRFAEDMASVGTDGAPGSNLCNPFFLERFFYLYSAEYKSQFVPVGFCVQVSNSSGSRKLYAMHLGLKGDLVALSKVGNFQRSFTRGPKQAQGSKSKGVCYLCLAGKETHDLEIPFEHFSPKAEWRKTYLTELPYETTPSILRGLPWGPPEEGPWFFKHDFWHNWHNGLAKVFLASAFVVINQSGLLSGRSIDARFEALSADYKAFCKRAKMHAYLKELTRDTFGMETAQHFPNGTWNKAAVSTHLMLYLGDFIDRYVEGQTDDPLLLAIAAQISKQNMFSQLGLLIFRYVFFVSFAMFTKAEATRLMNVAISVLYSEGFWIPQKRAKHLGEMIFKFLQCYQRCCLQSLMRNINRFSLVPKAHMIAHTAQQLLDEAAVAQWAVNPVATCNQMQEDFIGRGARISRRVHMNKVHTRTLQRSLLAVFLTLHGKHVQGRSR